MSITDELRKWGYGFCGSSYEAVTAIADRIDAEHEKAIRELNNLADASVLLPVDADGEVIRIGDVMEWVRYGNDDPTIVRTVVGVGIDKFFAWSNEQGRYAQYEAIAYRHHHAPTVEDLLDGFASAYDLIDGDDEGHQEYLDLIAEYAAKLRLADDGEER